MKPNIPVSVPWRSFRHFRDLRIWLLDNVGHDEYRLAGLDPKNGHNRMVYFTNEQDAIMFKMRWS